MPLTKNNMQTNGALIHIDEAPFTDELKIKRIGDHFREIMRILGMDTDDPGIVDTPDRVARMYVKEIFSGLNPANEPEVTLFEDPSKQHKMVIEKNITIYSYCEHHFVPIIGKAHVAYISTGKLIGLSKLNRIAQFHAQRPQLQERLTEDIAGSIQRALETDHVAVLIDAVHLCVASRGIKDTSSSTITSYYGGKFRNEDFRNEFLLTVK
jgi:GTP cyclohydrolase I